ncbi:hypothetical protein PROFUN_03260 [Planoprotostelium fungivorum]|uniref:DUF221-domain-containing protein n=1 Tax=Planoprotostelium fungivorum TaxID=1890364 RepID=A0A2P6NWP2_9EUKA|nr:hypothetical protein PROFUN_03260 [Planoprotostelium fungivorum]
MSGTANSPDSTAGNPNELYSSLAVAGATIVIVCIVWNVIRNRYPSFFYRKAYATNFGRDPIAPDIRSADGWFNWIPYTITYDTNQLILPNYGGLDMAIYVKFLGYAFWFFFINMILVCAALIPTYATGPNQFLAADDPNFVRGMNVITLSNLGSNDPKTWVAFASVFWVTITFCILIYLFWKDSMKLNFLDLTRDGARARMVMVHNIPDQFATSATLNNEFKRIYAENNVVKSIVNPKADDIRDLQDERRKNSDKLRVVRDLIAQGAERPQHRPKFIPGLSAKVDSEEHYNSELLRLDQEIDEKRSMLLNEGQTGNDINTREGFTAFNLRSIAMASSQTNHMDPHDFLTCEPAPEPENVFWQNLDVNIHARVVRWLISLTLVVLLFIFWAVPVTFLQGITSLDTLSRLGPFSFLAKVVDILPKFVVGIIQGILPSLALTIFMALLPTILKAIFSISAPRTHAKLDNDVMKSYFSFLFINVFLVTVIAGTIFKVIQKIIADPTTTPTLLAQGISAQTSFYINYLLVNLAGNFLFVSRLIPFLISRLLAKFLSKTREEKAKRDIPSPIGINIKITKELILFAIGLIYLTIGPLISVFATLYFGFSYLTSKYSFMFSITPAQDGAKMTPTIVTIVTCMMILYQLIMVGIFAIKFFEYGIIVIVCTPFTIGWYIYLRRRFRRAFMFVPVSMIPNAEYPREELEAEADKYVDPAIGPQSEYGPKLEIIYPEEAHPVPTEERTNARKEVEMESGLRMVYSPGNSPKPRST